MDSYDMDHTGDHQHHEQRDMQDMPQREDTAIYQELRYPAHTGDVDRKSVV